MELKSIAHKKQRDEYTYVFEYWEGENYLEASGQEQWIDYISELMTGIKVEGWKWIRK